MLLIGYSKLPHLLFQILTMKKPSDAPQFLKDIGTVFSRDPEQFRCRHVAFDAKDENTSMYFSKRFNVSY